ncbi:hypothetical protein [Nocardia sp. XZ_19_369]|uniref:hypothetical protein n=1 Tax=Nocardia sp. XZ_19_369 TaxID=2769487 RepID=UPI00188EE8E2|nr:hypothetical protein [Nocardia sp. XZ_19_369]
MGIDRAMPPGIAPGTLPTAGQYLRVFTGTEKATTTMLRTATELLAIWRQHYDTSEADTSIDPELLAQTVWKLDKQAKITVAKEVPAAPGTPFHPHTYGQLVAQLAQHQLLVQRHQHCTPEIISGHVHNLNQAIQTLDTVVAEAAAGRLRLRLLPVH